MAYCDPFRQNHKRFIVNTMIDQYNDLSDENLFLSIGKVTPWGATAGNDIPVSSVDSTKDEIDFWRGMVATKRINRSDVSLVIRRVEWASGTSYFPYRDGLDLFDDAQPADFYVLVDEERVYVCIDNNYNALSLIPPTHTDSIVRKLSDGYRWKFLYQIPESKRKFLTRSRSGVLGYMPVEFVESLKTNDDRTLQWGVQQAAVGGKIDFAYIDEGAKQYWITTPSCVLPNIGNLVVANVAPGATSIQIFSSELSANPTLYEGMLLSIDGGPGQGQRRIIDEYSWLGSYAVVVVSPLVLGLSGSVVQETQSYFSIIPNVVVDGDGSSNNNTNNPTSKTAEFMLKFGATSQGEEDNCQNFTPKFVTGIEIVDGGKEYTFANLSVPIGLGHIQNTPSEFLDFSQSLHAVIPPVGGHGANAPRELGSSSYMVVKEYNQDEDGNVDTDNDFRQFGILRNPLLSDTRKQVRIKFYQPGLSGTFAVGATAAQVGGPVGDVVSWCPGAVGTTATSELLLNNIRGGTFSASGVVNGLTVFDVVTNTYAGTEGRHLLKLTLSPVNGEFSSSGTTYLKKHFAHGVGNIGTNIPQSRSSGEIYCWEPTLGSNLSGSLYLENSKGNFTIGEGVLQTDPYFGGSNGLSGSGKVTAYSTSLEHVPEVYDLTTTVTLVGENFTSQTFIRDGRVTLVSGLTSASGHIVDWISALGGTNGTMLLSGVHGSVLTGQNVTYAEYGLTGALIDKEALVQSIDHLSDLKYRSGEVLYIQNIKPISRNIEQREEIKLVIEL